MAEKRESKVEKTAVPTKFERVNVDINTVYRPLMDYVVIEVEMEQKTAAGIIIPQAAQKSQRVQRVIATGPDCKLVKPGDLILVSPMCRPMSIDLIYKDGEQVEHIQLREYDLAGVVDPHYSTIINAAKSKSPLTVN